MELSRCSAGVQIEKAFQMSRKRNWATISSSYSSSYSSSASTTCSTASDASSEAADSRIQQRCKVPKLCAPQQHAHAVHAAAVCYAVNSNSCSTSIASASWDCRHKRCLQQLVRILQLLKYLVSMYSSTAFKLLPLRRTSPVRVCFVAAWHAKKLAGELLTTTGGTALALKALCVAKLGHILGLKLVLGVAQLEALDVGVQPTLPVTKPVTAFPPPPEGYRTV